MSSECNADVQYVTKLKPSQVYTSLDLTAFKSAAPAPATVATVLLLALGALAAVMMA